MLKVSTYRDYYICICEYYVDVLENIALHTVSCTSMCASVHTWACLLYESNICN